MANAQGYATKLALNNLLTYLDEMGGIKGKNQKQNQNQNQKQIPSYAIHKTMNH